MCVVGCGVWGVRCRVCDVCVVGCGVWGIMRRTRFSIRGDIQSPRHHGRGQPRTWQKKTKKTMTMMMMNATWWEVMQCDVTTSPMYSARCIMQSTLQRGGRTEMSDVRFVKHAAVVVLELVAACIDCHRDWLHRSSLQQRGAIVSSHVVVPTRNAMRHRCVIRMSARQNKDTAVTGDRVVPAPNQGRQVHQNTGR